MFKLSPSLSAGSQLNLKATLDACAGLTNLHLDVDDGNFVKDISFGMDTVRVVCENTPVPVDVHLEVLNPLAYVDELCEIGVDAACAHVEALPYPSAWLSGCRRGGIRKVGLALNLVTPTEVLESYVDQLDYVLFVSVERDSDGIVFRPHVCDRVRKARAFLGDDVEIWVDGGINEGNLEQVVRAGADGIVVGRAVMAAPDPIAAAGRLVALAEGYREEMAAR